MSWVAEILRKQHRVCSRCRLGPTHLYDPAPSGGEIGELGESSGTPLCNACLESKLAHDFARFPGRCLVFEPALGPEAFVYHPFDGRTAMAWPEQERAAAREWIEKLPANCSLCAETGRFAWIPVDADANLWGSDWISSLREGTLTPDSTLCGSCAARRLTRTFEQRGLYFEGIVPPRDGDGTLFCTELY